MRLGGLEPLGHDLLGRNRAAAFAHALPGALRRLSLDHQDVDLSLVVHPPCHHDVERREVELLVGRVDLPLAAHEPEPDRAHRAVERKPGQAHRQAGRVDANDVVGVGQVGREHGDDHLNLVPIALPEGGAQWTVDQPGGQDGRLGWSPLPPEEPAGDLPGRVHPLLDVNGQREEVDPFPGRRGGAGGQDLCLTERRHARALCLLGELAGFEDEFGSAETQAGLDHDFLLERGAALRVPQRFVQGASEAWTVSQFSVVGHGNPEAGVRN